jgi:hypothetical protein
VVGSNEHGRELEHVIALRLQKLCASLRIPCELSGATVAANARDDEYLKVQPLDKALVADFSACADAFARWIETQGWLEGATSATINRLTDEAGKKLDTSDMVIAIVKGKQKIVKKISVKHRHDALKHPRLPSIPDHLGVTDEGEKAAYIAKYNVIWEKFVSESSVAIKGKTTFKELKAMDKDYVNDKLYWKLNRLVIELLERYKNSKSAVQSFFSYIVAGPGNEFITVKNEKGRLVAIKHFEGIAQPSSMRRIEYPYKGRKTTFFVEFDNGWQITFRLHNISSEFYRNGKANITEKLDPLCINLEDMIRIEKIPKESQP